MSSSTKSTYGAPSIGCYLDQANYNNDELSGEIVNIAVGYGMEMDADLVALLAMTEDEIEACENYSEQMDWASEAAIDWLNEQETRSFMYWANEGEANAFGLWANIDGAKEDVGFVSHKHISEETDQDDASYPAADYRGEWLHVNDHGNCALYVRNDDGKDTEIWSVA